MSILNHRAISERYFFPRRDRPAEIRWVDVAGAKLACADFSLTDRPLLVHFHGNGETVADYVPDFASALADRGVGVFFAEYRGYGASTGTPSLGAMLDDVRAVVEATHTDPSKLVVYGRSVGSIFAIEAARQFSTLGGLILESGIADVYERLALRMSAQDLGVTDAEFRSEIAARIDHQRVLSSYAGPTLVLHTRGDHMVDVSHAQRNAKWAQHSTLTLFEQGDHNSILAYNQREIVDAIVQHVCHCATA
ncbi:MAG: alpha/beta hydrolase [Deltaproteobacteria bacterium]|nr:alpha/beta hydrolase [Deltaproteobacteria bacterium]